MPALLENFTEQQTRMTDLARTIEDKSQAVKDLPDSLQAQRIVVAVEEIAGLVPRTVSILDDWVQTLEGILRDGINGLDFRIFVHVSVNFVQMCELAADTLDRTCQQAEAFGESPQTTAARAVLANALMQMQTPKSKVLCWKKMADRRPPEIDPALIERGAEEIRQGHFKTSQQALEAIRGTPK